MFFGINVVTVKDGKIIKAQVRGESLPLEKMRDKTQTIIINFHQRYKKLLPQDIFEKSTRRFLEIDYTIETLFDLAESIITNEYVMGIGGRGEIDFNKEFIKGRKAIIKYDRKLGYPKLISVDYPEAGDEELKIEVIDIKFFR